MVAGFVLGGVLVAFGWAGSVWLHYATGNVCTLCHKRVLSPEEKLPDVWPPGDGCIPLDEP